MKIRKGFVSNSSSSSFIIGTDKGGKVTVDLNSIGDVFNNIEDFEKWFKNHYGWKDDTIQTILDDNTGLEDLYNDGIKLINEGKSVVYLDIDYDDEKIIDFLKSSKDINIIMED